MKLLTRPLDPSWASDITTMPQLPAVEGRLQGRGGDVFPLRPTSLQRPCSPRAHHMQILSAGRSSAAAVVVGRAGQELPCMGQVRAPRPRPVRQMSSRPQGWSGSCSLASPEMWGMQNPRAQPWPRNQHICSASSPRGLLSTLFSKEPEGSCSVQSAQHRGQKCIHCGCIGWAKSAVSGCRPQSTGAHVRQATLSHKTQVWRSVVQGWHHHSQS